MTLEEKLKLFYESTLEDANSQSAAIIDDYKKMLNQKYDHFQKEIEKKMDFLFETEKDELVREKNKIISQATKDAKIMLSEKVEDLKEQLFTEIEKKLSDYMKTEEYKEFLVKQITEAKSYAEDSDYTIYINTSDESLKEMLVEKTGANIAVSTIDFMGGIRVVIHTKNILIDNSFITKFAKEKESYLM